MTAFYQQTWDARVARMGDTAENVCDIIYNGRTHKLGLDRIWQNGVRLTLNQMTPQMRYTPDRMTINSFVECQGCGRDRTLKIKEEKIQALLGWNLIGPTNLGVYNMADNTWSEAPIAEWHHACLAHGHQDTFPEGKAYFALHAEHFPATPQPVPNNPE